ncbi:adenylate cyclase type 10-like [Anoplophora glabripennis]|uniref:adenylate cyclase type 10-like n=1 Tax=Anoplophora glabripennis TaxID=217634 RepID=UPI000C75B939|nr:adenylate cyclase type 10-like [Anoplophora glabripennis]
MDSSDEEISAIAYVFEEEEKQEKKIILVMRCGRCEQVYLAPFKIISGFTDLCEKYNKSGKGGPSRLTQVLNNYIGAMVQEILSHGGDVLKFSGDAFIALWKVSDQLSMRDAVHEAIDCSLVIQKSYGSYRTDVDVVVRVKLAVASGHLVFSLVGDEENSHYLMTGDPIYAIKAAEHKSSAGEIVITARVSRHISANEYLLSVLPDGLHAKVLGVGPNWRNIQRKTNKDTYSHFERDLEGRTSILSDASLLTYVVPDGEPTEEDEITPIVTDQYALRPAVNHAARMKLKDELRKFIIAPVVRGIDASEPLEYLTEIRQVAILFLNCKVSSMVGPVEGIDVADHVYITVCNAVKDRYGCVNKISNFDKDLMLLIVFGLRGFKHELESQIALKCATECYEKIKAIKEIDEVAAGVTTGGCYCGAFGHTLRREYTVIGLVVNKAARLMVAYPNKVTCDRETFLYSKLEARNFILQEFKPLKGIVHPGPIYEFKEVERANELGFSFSPFPLLGREQELDLYNTLLQKAMEFSQKKGKVPDFFKMLIIRGDFRQGKTRLLEEVLFASNPAIPIHTFTLTPYDREISFRTIQLIFDQFIGMPGRSSRTSRERKINVRLQEHDVEECYFVFNQVFDVRFPVTMRMRSTEDKLQLLYKLFTLLSLACFTKFWIIAVDDADYIDDESWMLLQVLLDLRLLFILVTMGTQKELTSYALQVMKNESIKIITLKPIDKWFHVGLVCQMLGIEGIPPELEKMVQVKSNGNPGWIESFLVTLVQSGGIDVKEMKRIDAYNSGMVMPPLYMLMRLSQAEIDLWMEVMEEKTLSKKDDVTLNRWKIFVDSCRESYPDLTVSKAFEDYKKEKVTQICVLNPQLNPEDVVPEQHMNVVILKTFDSLTSYEQLLLKCSSILGDIFTRDMLLYIMSSTASRLTSLAVQKLFEIQVLCCARGNFLEGGLSFKDRLIDPNEDLSVKCDCIGLIIDDTCIDLPKFASCGYMRFRSSEFRETTYNLLTDNQKREFHAKAIRYMEKETRRCRACGSGYFARYLGSGKFDDGLRPRTKRKSSIVSQDSNDAHTEKTSGVGAVSTSNTIVSSHKSTLLKSDNIRISSLSALSSIRASGVDVFSSNGFGIATIRRLKDSYNLVRTFSTYDYSQCTCLLILSTMYSQMIEHCKGAGLVEKIMEATIEYSYVCMETKNAPQAIKVVEEALELLEGPMKDQIELEWMVALKRGKLFTLIGRARMALEDGEAYNYLMDALNCYGIKFPTSNIGKSVLKNHLKLKQALKLYVFPPAFSRSFDEDVAEYCNNVSECLHLLCIYFSIRKRWKEAELAAVWSLNKAMETETDFEVLCLAYESMLRMASVKGQHRLCVALEVFALSLCHRKNTIVEIQELKAVSKLYYQIFRSRFLRGEIDKAMSMAYPIWRISNAACYSELLFISFPLLAHGTIIRNQVVEFGNILTELSYLIDQDVDKSERIWYHALCLVLNLETGVIAQPIEKCNQFILSEALTAHVRDAVGKSRLIICKWLWDVRNDNWESATVLQNMAWKYAIADNGEKLSHLISGLYLLEGLIIYMVNKMDMKNLRASTRADQFICTLFRKLKKTLKNCPLLQPRVYHMKAYYTMAKYNNFKGAFKYLRKAHSLAEKQHNDLEVSWIQHSEQAWINKLSQEAKFAWREHCDAGVCIQFNDADLVDKVLPYSLPLPIYI